MSRREELARLAERAHEDWCMENEDRDPWHKDSWNRVAVVLIEAGLPEGGRQMSAHEDWLNAKRKRDNAAFSLSKAYLAGNIAVANQESVKFMEADTEMERIEKELDNRGGK